MDLVYFIISIIRVTFMDQGELAAENLTLLQELAVLQRQSKLPRVKERDRIFWVWLSSTTAPHKVSSRRERGSRLRKHGSSPSEWPPNGQAAL